MSEDPIKELQALADAEKLSAALLANPGFLKDAGLLETTDLEINLTGETARAFLDAFSEAPILRAKLEITRSRLKTARILLFGFWVLSAALTWMRLAGE